MRLLFWHKAKTKKLTKIILVLMQISLLIPGVSWAFEPGFYRQGLPAIQFHNQTISIDKRFGQVEGCFQGQNRLVVFIEDLHCNYEIQNNIANIIDQLAGQQGLSLVAVEGAWGRIDPGLLANIPVPWVKQEISRWLMRQGKLTGAEYYAATGRHSIALTGAEQPELYQQSLQTVLRFLTDEVQGCLADLEDALDELKPGIYGSGLMRFDRQKTAFRKNELSLLKYAAFLIQSSRQQGLDLSAYPALQAYGQAKNHVDSDNLMVELERLDQQLRLRQYTSEKERRLDSMIQRLGLLRRLLDISALPAEVEAFRSHPEIFFASEIYRFVETCAPGTGTRPEDMGLLDRDLKLVLEFYGLADRRSQAFVDTLLKNMEQQKTGLAVLVAGGFHSSLVLERLRASGVSYLRVRPVLAHDDVVNPYFSILRGQPSSLEKLLAKDQVILAPRLALSAREPLFQRLVRTLCDLGLIVNQLRQPGQAGDARIAALLRAAKTNPATGTRIVPLTPGIFAVIRQSLEPGEEAALAPGCGLQLGGRSEVLLDKPRLAKVEKEILSEHAQAWSRLRGWLPGLAVGAVQTDTSPKASDLYSTRLQQALEPGGYLEQRFGEPVHPGVMLQAGDQHTSVRLKDEEWMLDPQSGKKIAFRCQVEIPEYRDEKIEITRHLMWIDVLPGPHPENQVQDKLDGEVRTLLKPLIKNHQAVVDMSRKIVLVGQRTGQRYTLIYKPFDPVRLEAKLMEIYRGLGLPSYRIDVLEDNLGHYGWVEFQEHYSFDLPSDAPAVAEILGQRQYIQWAHWFTLGYLLGGFDFVLDNFLLNKKEPHELLGIDFETSLDPEKQENFQWFTGFFLPILVFEGQFRPTLGERVNRLNGDRDFKHALEFASAKYSQPEVLAKIRAAVAELTTQGFTRRRLFQNTGNYLKDQALHSIVPLYIESVGPDNLKALERRCQALQQEGRKHALLMSEAVESFYGFYRRSNAALEAQSAAGRQTVKQHAQEELARLLADTRVRDSYYAGMLGRLKKGYDARKDWSPAQWAPAEIRDLLNPLLMTIALTEKMAADDPDLKIDYLQAVKDAGVILDKLKPAGLRILALTSGPETLNILASYFYPQTLGRPMAVLFLLAGVLDQPGDFRWLSALSAVNSQCDLLHPVTERELNNAVEVAAEAGWPLADKFFIRSQLMRILQGFEAFKSSQPGWPSQAQPEHFTLNEENQKSHLLEAALAARREMQRVDSTSLAQQEESIAYLVHLLRAMGISHLQVIKINRYEQPHYLLIVDQRWVVDPMPLASPSLASLGCPLSPEGVLVGKLEAREYYPLTQVRQVLREEELPSLRDIMDHGARLPEAVLTEHTPLQPPLQPSAILPGDMEPLTDAEFSPAYFSTQESRQVLQAFSEITGRVHFDFLERSALKGQAFALVPEEKQIPSAVWSGRKDAQGNALPGQSVQTRFTVQAARDLSFRETLELVTALDKALGVERPAATPGFLEYLSAAADYLDELRTALADAPGLGAYVRKIASGLRLLTGQAPASLTPERRRLAEVWLGMDPAWQRKVRARVETYRRQSPAKADRYIRLFFNRQMLRWNARIRHEIMEPYRRVWQTVRRAGEEDLTRIRNAPQRLMRASTAQVKESFFVLPETMGFGRLRSLKDDQAELAEVVRQEHEVLEQEDLPLVEKQKQLVIAVQALVSRYADHWQLAGKWSLGEFQEMARNFGVELDLETTPGEISREADRLQVDAEALRAFRHFNVSEAVRTRDLACVLATALCGRLLQTHGLNVYWVNSIVEGEPHASLLVKLGAGYYLSDPMNPSRSGPVNGNEEVFDRILQDQAGVSFQGQWDGRAEEMQAMPFEQGMNSNLWFNLALALSVAGKTREAIQACRFSLEANPYWKQIWEKLAQLYYQTNQFQRSLEAARHSDSLPTLVMAGHCSFCLGDYPAAQARLRETIGRAGNALLPFIPINWYYLGRIHLESGELAESQACFNTTLSQVDRIMSLPGLDATDVAAFKALKANCFFQLSRLAEARSLYEELEASGYSLEAEEWFNWGCIQASVRNQDRTLQAWIKARETGYLPTRLDFEKMHSALVTLGQSQAADRAFQMVEHWMPAAQEATQGQRFDQVLQAAGVKTARVRPSADNEATGGLWPETRALLLHWLTDQAGFSPRASQRICDFGLSLLVENNTSLAAGGALISLIGLGVAVYTGSFGFLLTHGFQWGWVLAWAAVFFPMHFATSQGLRAPPRKIWIPALLITGINIGLGFTSLTWWGLMLAGMASHLTGNLIAAAVQKLFSQPGGRLSAQTRENQSLADSASNGESLIRDAELVQQLGGDAVNQPWLKTQPWIFRKAPALHRWMLFITSVPARLADLGSDAHPAVIADLDNLAVLREIAKHCVPGIRAEITRSGPVHFNRLSLRDHGWQAWITGSLLGRGGLLDNPRTGLTFLLPDYITRVLLAAQARPELKQAPAYRLAVYQAVQIVQDQSLGQRDVLGRALLAEGLVSMQQPADEPARLNQLLAYGELLQQYSVRLQWIDVAYRGTCPEGLPVTQLALPAMATARQKAAFLEQLENMHFQVSDQAKQRLLPRRFQLSWRNAV